MDSRQWMKALSARVLIGSALIVVLAIPNPVRSGEKSKLQWLTFDRGITEARNSGRKILVDVYTDWCGWCKKMDAETYNEKSVSDYLRSHYVLIRLNAESDARLTYNGKAFSERELASAFGISGYPTTLFLQSNGEPITRYPGYAEAGRFRKVLSFIAEDYYRKVKFEDYLAAP